MSHSKCFFFDLFFTFLYVVDYIRQSNLSTSEFLKDLSFWKSRQPPPWSMDMAFIGFRVVCLFYWCTSGCIHLGMPRSTVHMVRFYGGISSGWPYSPTVTTGATPSNCWAAWCVVAQRWVLRHTFATLATCVHFMSITLKQYCNRGKKYTKRICKVIVCLYALGVCKIVHNLFVFTHYEVSHSCYLNLFDYSMDSSRNACLYWIFVLFSESN